MLLLSNAHFRVNGRQIVHLVVEQGILIRKEVILHSTSYASSKTTLHLVEIVDQLLLLYDTLIQIVRYGHHFAFQQHGVLVTLVLLPLRGVHPLTLLLTNPSFFYTARV